MILFPDASMKSVIHHPLVRGVSLTGSTRAGRVVAAQAGEALKKVVLELGGSDPLIVLEDADLDKAVETAIQARFGNAGQSCIAAKRFIVVDAILQPFTEHLTSRIRQMHYGDPMDEKTFLGPMARKDLRDHLHQQVLSSVSLGGRLILGGKIPKGEGCFYPPTLLTDVKPGMPAYEEELFGPVAVIINVRDEAEAVRVAQDTSYGLGASIFTQDLERGERLAHQIEAGSCFVNAQVHSDPRLPFGGVKNSGVGRELSHYGMHEFVNVKTVYIA